MPVSFLLVSGVCALVAVAVFLGWDRHHWRTLYFKLLAEKQEREQSLFDQMLKVKGFRQVGENLQPVKAASPHPVVGEEDMDVLADRFNEYIENNLLTYSEAQRLTHAVQYGEKTRAEIDKILFDRQRERFTGSVLDVVE